MRSTWIGVCADVSMFEASGTAAKATNSAAAPFSACTTLGINLLKRGSSSDLVPAWQGYDYRFLLRNACATPAFRRVRGLATPDTILRRHRRLAQAILTFTPDAALPAAVSAARMPVCGW
jgi:hypothetical protein